MGKLVKCPVCEDKLDKDDSYSHNKRYYHPKCYKTMMNEREDYQSLLDYVIKLFGEDKPLMLLKKQIKDMKDDGYKYKGMELALKYFFDTLGNRVQEGTGVGIIPYVYEDAKNHYIKQKRIASSLQEISSDKNKEITVYINTNKSKRQTKQIDISSI